MYRKFTILLATDINGGIANADGSLPWKNTDEGKIDIARFRKRTTGNIIIMGRKTFESIGKQLPNRTTIVISRNNSIANEPNDLFCCASFGDAMKLASKMLGKIYIVGGRSIFDVALNHSALWSIVWTVFKRDHNCHVKYEGYKLFMALEVYKTRELNDVAIENKYIFNREEANYLDLIASLIKANRRPNRTNIYTRGLFGQTLRVSLRDHRGRTLPILTTKKIATKTIYTELLWFLSGATNAKWLQSRNVHIWDGNSSAEFLQAAKLDYDEGQLGPIYGHQWRHWGGDWRANDGGIDQLANVIENIKKDPYNRRHIVSAWNVGDLKYMALPPCHYSFQFWVGDNKLSILVNMRSSDVGLGVPFNLVSYAWLCHMVSILVNIEPGELILNMGDTHIYETHIEALTQQLSREPNRWPVLIPPKNIALSSIDDFVAVPYSSWVISEYDPAPLIAMKMVV